MRDLIAVYFKPKEGFVMNRRILRLAAAMAALPTASHAAPFILSYGGAACGTFAQANAQDHERYLSWAVGYISGENVKSTGRAETIGNTWNEPAISQWLLNYCGSHPTDLFATAVEQLRNALAQAEGIKP